MAHKQANNVRGRQWLSQFGVALGILGVLLSILFFPSFQPGQVPFSNDSPLGVIYGDAEPPLSSFTGYWQDLNWLGIQQPSALPAFTQAIYALLGPLVWGEGGRLLYAKFYPAVGLLILGMSAWLLAYRQGWGVGVAVLVALAMMLNSDAFSHACWGLPTIPLGLAAILLALAALSGQGPIDWKRLVLAGFAVGLAIMEGFDVGAILSLYVAAFVMFQALVPKDGTAAGVPRGLMRVAIVAVAAGWMAASALSTLIGTQVKGVAGMAQDDATRAQRWSEATQWSLPRIETLQLVVPGLFGYRMDTPDGGNYWGGVGRDPAWDEYLAAKNPNPAQRPSGRLIRHSGAGFYAGVVVVVIGVWGVVNSWRRNGPYSRDEKRLIWFWVGAALVSLVLAYGRHAPFYQWIYQLPFFSTIRNPIKFLHPLEISLVILFGYGLHGLWRGYVEPGRLVGSGGMAEQLRAWWGSAQAGDRRWVMGSVGVAILAGLSWLLYSSAKESMVRYLAGVGFEDRQMALEMARYSAGEAGLGWVFLALSVGLVVLLMSGALSGRRQRLGLVLVGVVLVMDLARANLPWIVYYDAAEKYASNPVIDMLQEEVPTHRVTGRVMPRGGMNLVSDEGRIFASVYNEWLEHLFQYYRVQSLDIIQMPRVPLLDDAYLKAFQPAHNDDFRRVARMWELTNTRYVLGMTGFLGFLNQQVDAEAQPFKVHNAFVIHGKPGVEEVERLSQLTVTPMTNGPFALFEFEGALPRAQLHRHWELPATDESCLERLLAADFDPRRTVLVSGEGALPDAGPLDASQPAEEVVIAEYRPKRVELQTRTTVPSVLLLNDRWHEHWQVFVNGERRELLRCNYLMRGVYLEPGEATVEFRFAPPVFALYLSLAAIAFGAVLVGLMVAGTGTQGQEQGKGRGTIGIARGRA